MIDLERLLAEADTEPPCGPNLEHDDAMRELALAVEGVPDQLMGEKRVAGSPPNWKKARELGGSLLERTKDVRVATQFARALVRTDGLMGMADGLRLVHGLLDKYWTVLHPQLEEGGRDSTMRTNALSALADGAGFLSDFRQAILAEEPRAGRVSVRDVLIASNKLSATADETVAPLPMIEGVLRHAATQDRPRIEQVAGLTALVKQIQDLLSEKVNAVAAVELAPLYETVAPISALCRQALDAGEPASAAGEDAPPPQGHAPGSGVPGEIRSREDAAALLERVCNFLERHEPANPAPLLIRRAQRLLTKSFVQIIEDIAPNSLGEIKALGGLKDE